MPASILSGNVWNSTGTARKPTDHRAPTQRVIASKAILRAQGRTAAIASWSVFIACHDQGFSPLRQVIVAPDQFMQESTEIIGHARISAFVPGNKVNAAISRFECIR